MKNSKQYIKIDRCIKPSSFRHHISYYSLEGGRYRMIAAFHAIHVAPRTPVKIRNSYNESSLSKSAVETRIRRVSTYFINYVDEEEENLTMDEYIPAML